jgi:hypothetical protein
MNEHPLAVVIDEIGKALTKSLGSVGIGFTLVAHLPHDEGTDCAISVVGNMPTEDAKDLLRDCADRMTEHTVTTSERVM